MHPSSAVDSRCIYRIVSAHQKILKSILAELFTNKTADSLNIKQIRNKFQKWKKKQNMYKLITFS